MEIPRDAYRAIEDIVGPRYVSDDPAILDSYAFEVMAETIRPNQSHFMPRPWAVVMPDTAEEVQAVTRICNKYKIKVKPISTGWYHWAAPLTDNSPRCSSTCAAWTASSRSTRRTASPSSSPT